MHQTFYMSNFSGLQLPSYISTTGDGCKRQQQQKKTLQILPRISQNCWLEGNVMWLAPAKPFLNRSCLANCLSFPPVCPICTMAGEIENRRYCFLDRWISWKCDRFGITLWILCGPLFICWTVYIDFMRQKHREKQILSSIELSFLLHMIYRYKQISVH